MRALLHSEAKFCLSKAQWEAENYFGVFSLRGRLRRQCVLISSINDRREGTHQGEGESIPDITQPWECTDERGDLLSYLGGGPGRWGSQGECRRVLRNLEGAVNSKLKHLFMICTEENKKLH